MSCHFIGLSLVHVPFESFFILIFNFDFHLFWLIVANYFFGLVIEDFSWFIVNPKWGGLKNFNSEKVYWHRWHKFGRFEIPDFYIYFLALGVIVLVFLYN